MSDTLQQVHDEDIRIFIVEDHPIMRDLLMDFLEALTDFEIIGAAASAEEALRNIEDNGANFLLIDVSLPGMSGIDLISEVKRRWPKMVCLMYSAHTEPDYVRQSLVAGANGYVVKGNPDELPVAIEQIAAGNIYLSTPVKSEAEK